MNQSTKNKWLVKICMVLCVFFFVPAVSAQLHTSSSAADDMNQTTMVKVKGLAKNSQPATAK